MKMTSALFSGALLLAGSTSFVAGCGSSDDAVTPTTGTGGSAGSAGKGGSSGAAGAAG